MRLRLLDSQPLRLLLTAATAVVLLSVGAERALYRTSIQAVVNAPRIPLLAPVDGMVDSAFVRLGSAVRVGQPVARIRRDAWSADAGGTLGVRLTLLRERIDIIARQLESLVELEESLRGRAARYRSTQVTRLEADLRAAEARAHERRLAFEQAASLRLVDGVSQADLERVRAEVASTEGEVVRLRAALASARAGIVVDESGQDAPYSQQRLDQLVIDIARLRAERDGMKAELRALSAGNVITGDSSTTSVVVSAPTTGVLWSAPALTGQRVARGAPIATLVDCANVFLEATVPPRDGDDLRPGTAVLVHFAGQAREYRGHVQSVRGGGTRFDGDDAAELPSAERRGDSRVIVAFDSTAVTSDAGNFCQVGRHAKVIFAEHAPWRPLTRLSAWLN
jgi:multidrug resistance efflux pump